MNDSSSVWVAPASTELATPALAGATTFVTLAWFGAPAMVAGLAGFAVALAIRAGAILWHWALPGFGGPVDADG